MRENYDIVFYNNDIALIDTITKGRSVFANRDFIMGEILTVDSFLILDTEVVRSSVLRNYCWGVPQRNHTPYPARYIFPLGITPLLNHSTDPNLSDIWDYAKKLVTVMVIKNIKRGEELVHDYGTRKLWFKYLENTVLPKEILDQLQ